MHRARRWALAASSAILLTLLMAGTVSAEKTEPGIDLRSVAYKSQLKRDPFDIPDFNGEGKRLTRELDLATTTLVGVVKLPDGYTALVEDENGDSYALAKGDPVWRGRVSTIDEETLVAWIRNGETRQRIRLELVKEGD
jgi:hypothetical protein